MASFSMRRKGIDDMSFSLRSLEVFKQFERAEKAAKPRNRALKPRVT